MKREFSLARLVGWLLVCALILVGSATTIIQIAPKHLPPINQVNITIPEGQSFLVKATGYSIGIPYNTTTRYARPVITKGFITFGGLDFFTIAADPAIIPLGSLVYIDSLGVGFVTDTGPAIQAFEIDICFPSPTEALQWGKRNIRVTLLKKG
jgi:3D (Asp-Asp-Asp) domain-containing protein